MSGGQAHAVRDEPCQMVTLCPWGRGWEVGECPLFFMDGPHRSQHPRVLSPLCASPLARFVGARERKSLLKIMSASPGGSRSHLSAVFSLTTAICAPVGIVSPPFVHCHLHARRPPSSLGWSPLYNEASRVAESSACPPLSCTSSPSSSKSHLSKHLSGPQHHHLCFHPSSCSTACPAWEQGPGAGGRQTCSCVAPWAGEG